MWCLIAVFALTSTASVDATATRLDGTTAAGRLETWDNDKLELTTAQGTEPIPTTELQSIRFAPPSPPQSGTLAPILIAIDGSTIPIQGFEAPGQRAVATIDGAADPLDSQSVELPLRIVQAVRLQSLDASVMEHWREALETTATSDVLVVVKRGGRSLDYMEGIVGKIAIDTIEFTFDGTRIDVPRKKVAGIVFYRPKAETSAAPCVLVGRDHLRLAAKSVRFDGDQLHVVTMAGARIDWPMGHIQLADFSAGKIVYLGDVKPASQSWQPLVGLPETADNLAKLGQPRFDQSATGGPLSLWYPGEAFAEGSGRLQNFDRGIAIRSRTELVYRLPRGFSRFAADAGIEPSVRISGNVKLTVYGDDQPLMEAAISGRDAPLSIQLDVASVRRLRIVVDYGDNLDTGDWLNLCNARIIK